MAITISTDPTYIQVRVEMIDYDGEAVVKVFDLKGTALQADIEAILDGLEAVSNAKISKVSVVSVRTGSGMAVTAKNALQNKISAVMTLGFEREDPINSNKVVRKVFQVPAYLDALEGVGGSVNAEQSDLADLITLLEANLVYVDNRTTIPTYNAVFDYDPTASGFGTVTREFNGTPGY